MAVPAEKLDTELSKLSREKLISLGLKLKTRLDEYKKSRKNLELQWMKNYRQLRGQYDPEIAAQIPTDRSRAYPKLTRTKVVGLLARMMEMMFPGSEKNWSLKPSPVPNVPEEALNEIIQQLRNQAIAEAQAAAAQAAEQGQQLPQSFQPPTLSDDIIEQAIKEWTAKRAQRMEEECNDQLVEMEFEAIVKLVVRSAIMYGLGVMRGPMNTTFKRRGWEQDGAGNYIAVVKTQYRPIFAFVRLWDFFADFELKSFRTSGGFFERHVLSRHQLKILKERPDFLSDQIDEFLSQNANGNYRETDYEQQLKTTSPKNATAVGGTTDTPYEAMQFVGFMSKREMSEMGVRLTDPEIRPDDDVLMDVWLLEDTVIKAIPLVPFEEPTEHYHLFVFEDENEGSALGPALPENIRDSQMAVSGAARMLFDNASVSAGPVFEVNRDLLSPGQNVAIQAFRTLYREGQGQESQYPAIRAYKFDSHVNENLAIMSTFRDMADEEAMMPKFASGFMNEGSEAFRTTGSASMLFGAANMTVKDLVRQFDKFMVSAIGALVKWNTYFGSRPDIIGDFDVVPKGATSLVAKEMRATALDQFAVTLQPDEKPYVKTRVLLAERLKVRDLSPEEILETEEDALMKIEAQMQAQQATMAADNQLKNARSLKLEASAKSEMLNLWLKGKLTDAQVKEILSRVDKNLADIDLNKKEGRMQMAEILLGAMNTPAIAGPAEIQPDTGEPSL